MGKKRYDNRHTMGQDWGGRRPSNPPNAPRITRKQVEAYADAHNMEIQREGYWWASGIWKGRIKGSNIWRSLGQTNYLALECMKEIFEEDGFIKELFEKDVLQK